LQAKEIKALLKSLTREASLVEPSLANRLEQINRWVKNLKPGSLMAKKFVLLFLRQMLNDSQIFLAIQSLSSPEERELYYQQMKPTERYWFEDLFPKWLREKDPKFYIWRQKLMSGEFGQEDKELLEQIVNNISLSKGTVVQRYIADLSMATDLIVSGSLERSLCIQLTSVSDELSQEKSKSWEESLRMWRIDRGLFLSYNPGKADFVEGVVEIVLENSNNLNSGSYQKLSL
jgi:hypothetical protein